MSLVTVVYAMIAGVGFTLAMVHLPVWFLNRESRTSLAFTVAALCTGAIACAELLMLTATSPAAFAQAQRWNHLPIALLFVALSGFGYQFLGAGRRWLALAGILLRIVALAINFRSGDNLAFREVTALTSVEYLGERVAFPVGERNPWLAITQFDALLLMLFFADASRLAWRRGAHAVALLVGGSLTFFMLASAVRSFLVLWLDWQVPSMTSLFSLGVVLVMGYAMSADLLRARQLAHGLAERELQANLTAEAANMGTWVRDIPTGAIRMSPKARELLGFGVGEAVSFDTLVQRIRADDRAGFEERLALAARECGPYHAEFPLTLPDGQVRWIAVMGRVVCDSRGQPLRSRGACLDVTARKMQERETLRLRHDIAHVGRVSVMGQLASALAHEINQPLGAILRNAEAASLFMNDPSPDLAEIAAIVEDIRKDDLRASAVIDRMRALLRRQTMSTEVFDTGQMLGDVVRLMRPDALARHIALRLAAPQGLPPVQGDRVQLQQVLLNLIQNGMDAVGPDDGRAGTRSVVVAAHRPTLDILEITVSDSGSGLPAGVEEHVFEPFFTTKKAGIGLGLAISRSIVEAHGGRLRAENDAEGGATFRFTLPAART